MWKEEEYFGESKLVDYCGQCREELYSGQEGYYDGDTGEWYCSMECAVEALGIKEVTSDEEFSAVCPYCGNQLNQCCETVIVDGIYFCDNVCALGYLNVKSMDVFQ